MVLQAVVMTQEEAAAWSGSSTNRRPRRASGLSRPRGAVAVVEPWYPIKGSPSMAQALATVRKRFPEAYIPSSYTSNTCTVHFEGSWHKFLMLDGRLRLRKVFPAKGRTGLGYMPCDACHYRAPSGELHTLIVGPTVASVQSFHVCPACIAEGVVILTQRTGLCAREAE